MDTDWREPGRPLATVNGSGDVSGRASVFWRQWPCWVAGVPGNRLGGLVQADATLLMPYVYMYATMDTLNT